MSKVKFIDHTEEVENLLADLAQATLAEVGGALVSRVKRNTKVGRVAGGQLKNSWTYQIRQKGDEYNVIVGSPLERSMWIEFGTGEYALYNNGRTGGWYIPVGSGEGEISETVAKAYKMTILNGKDGKKWVHTYGMKPQRPFWKAYTTSKNALIRLMQNRLGKGLS